MEKFKKKNLDLIASVLFLLIGLFNNLGSRSGTTRYQ